MNTVAELAKANAQEIFDKVEEHLLFITEFSTTISANMSSYLFDVNHFSVEHYRTNLDRIPNEKAGFRNMIELNLNKVSGKRRDCIERLLKHVEDVPVIKLQMILEALQFKSRLFDSNQVLDFAINFQFDQFLTEFYELGDCTITEDKVRVVLLAKQQLDEYVASTIASYLQAKRDYKGGVIATFVSNKLISRLQVEAAKFEQKFLESAKNNYLLTFHYQSRAQEKMKDFIEFKPD